MRSDARGFSLIEVLVSLVIIAVGLLGIAKIQAIAFGETGTSSLRSIAAIEASSMAASMRADRSYWARGASLNPAPLDITATGTTVTSTDPTAPASPNCTSPAVTYCSDVAMATYDLQQWAAALNQVLGGGANYNAAIHCPTTTQPISCTITINWTERVANTASGTGVANTAFITPTYTLFVQP